MILNCRARAVFVKRSEALCICQAYAWLRHTCPELCGRCLPLVGAVCAIQQTGGVIKLVNIIECDVGNTPEDLPGCLCPLLICTDGTSAAAVTVCCSDILDKSLQDILEQPISASRRAHGNRSSGQQHVEVGALDLHPQQVVQTMLELWLLHQAYQLLLPLHQLLAALGHNMALVSELNSALRTLSGSATDKSNSSSKTSNLPALQTVEQVRKTYTPNTSPQHFATLLEVLAAVLSSLQVLISQPAHSRLMSLKQQLQDKKTRSVGNVSNTDSATPLSPDAAAEPRLGTSLVIADSVVAVTTGANKVAPGSFQQTATSAKHVEPLQSVPASDRDISAGLAGGSSNVDEQPKPHQMQPQQQQHSLPLPEAKQHQQRQQGQQEEPASEDHQYHKKKNQLRQQTGQQQGYVKQSPMRSSSYPSSSSSPCTSGTSSSHSDRSASSSPTSSSCSRPSESRSTSLHSSIPSPDTRCPSPSSSSPCTRRTASSISQSLPTRGRSPSRSGSSALQRSASPYSCSPERRQSPPFSYSRSPTPSVRRSPSPSYSDRSTRPCSRSSASYSSSRSSSHAPRARGRSRSRRRSASKRRFRYSSSSRSRSGSSYSGSPSPSSSQPPPPLPQPRHLAADPARAAVLHRFRLSPALADQLIVSAVLDFKDTVGKHRDACRLGTWLAESRDSSGWRMEFSGTTSETHFRYAIIDFLGLYPDVFVIDSVERDDKNPMVVLQPGHLDGLLATRVFHDMLDDYLSDLKWAARHRGGAMYLSVAAEHPLFPRQLYPYRQLFPSFKAFAKVTLQEHFQIVASGVNGTTKKLVAIDRMAGR